MLISNIINDGFGLISKQLRFYCWHYKRDLHQRQRQELINILHEQHFERLANKIKLLIQSNIADCRQQIARVLFEQCLAEHRRHQVIQLIESKLVDINVRLDNYGRTLLHRMAYNLDVDLVKLLIDSGVNIRLRDYAGNTALHIAIQSYRNGTLIYNNEPDVVQNLKTIISLLLEADKNLQNERLNYKKIKLDERNHCQKLGCQSSQVEVNNSSREICTLNDEIVSKVSNLTSPARQTSQAVNCQTNRSQNLCKHHGRMSVRGANSFSYNSQTTDQELPGTKRTVQSNYSPPPCPIDPILMEDLSCSLVDTKDAFGRTALHYCVLVVGEQHLSSIVELLISFGADPDSIDTRLKTPLYCLVKRPGVSAIRQKCLAITHLLNSGCDDLGLAIDPRTHFTEDRLNNLEKNISSLLQGKQDKQVEPIFTQSTFMRVPSLKHLARLALIRFNAEKYNKLSIESVFVLPPGTPCSLSHYVNRKILDQSELF